MSTYGPLRSVARDQHGERLWICSERHAFELLTEKEDRGLLRLKPYAVLTKIQCWCFVKIEPCLKLKP